MDSYNFVQFVVNMFRGVIDTLDSVVISYRVGTSTVGIPIFYILISCVVFSIIINLFVRSGKG